MKLFIMHMYITRVALELALREGSFFECDHSQYDMSTGAAHQHLRCTIDGPRSSYSCLVIHICSDPTAPTRGFDGSDDEVEVVPSMEPPTQAEY